LAHKILKSCTCFLFSPIATVAGARFLLANARISQYGRNYGQRPTFS
jgi:hypothetical protein